MRRFLMAVLLLVASAAAQDWTAVSATKLSYVDKSPIATGKLCVTGTDAKDNAIAFRAGDSGQVAKYTRCVTITDGVAAALEVPNPAATIPSGVTYRFEVKDNSGVVLTYKGVTFTGASFDFDSYIPTSAPIPNGQSVDKLTVGELRITRACTGCGSSGGTGTAGVSSFNGREGAVMPLPNDYSWNQIASKPSTFTPSPHVHPAVDISTSLALTQLPLCSVDGQVYKRVSGSMACAADATGEGGTGAVTSFNGQTGDVTYAPAWTDVTAKPTTFTPATHTHTVSGISDFPLSWAWAAISGKPTNFQADWSSTIINKPSTFTPAAHTHNESEVTGLTNDLAGKAEASALSSHESATAVHGATSTPTASRIVMFDATGKLDKTGLPSLTKSDVGLGNVDNTSDANKPISSATQTALDGKAASSHTQAISTITGLQTALDGKQASGDYAAANAATTVNGQSCALSGSCTVTADPTSAKYKSLSCAVGIGDGLNAIPTGDYVLDGQCLNNKATVTISSIKCFADAGSSTAAVKDNSTNDLATTFTATSSWATGSPTATTTIALGAWTKWTLHADGTSKQIECVLTGSY